MIVAELKIVASLNIPLRRADARPSIACGGFGGVAGSFWARLRVQGSACVLNPLIVVPDPNLAAPARTASWLCALRSHKPDAWHSSAGSGSFGVAPVRPVARVGFGPPKRPAVGGGLRPRDEWTPSALPRYSELLTANMLTTLRLRVKRRCRRPGAPPGHDPATVARVRRRTPGVLVEFGLVCDGTGRGIVAW